MSKPYPFSSFPGLKMRLLYIIYKLSPSYDQTPFICAQVARDRGKAVAKKLTYSFIADPGL